MKFEWDAKKAKSNAKKHNDITFKEAAEVFIDKKGVEDYDDEHSDSTEVRYVRIGNSSKRLLRVSFTIRQDEAGGEIIRIISARKGRRKEEKNYDQNNQ